MNAIEIRGLTRSFAGRRAVDALNLDIAQGELLALLGVNGAGKTTTIRMLCGLLKPDSGEALLGGHSILSDLNSVKRIISVSPQESAVAAKLTVRENLQMMAQIYGLNRAEARRRVDRCIQDFGMDGIMNQRAGTLSGGWQRRLSIAMALISDPQILFLDEPTLGLDVLARRELWKLVRGLHGRVTILLTTHYMEEAEALADRIGILQNGRLNVVGTAAQLMAQTGAQRFEDAFLALAVPKGGENT